MTTKHPWHDIGVWLMGDTHVHHRQTGLQRVVDEASQYGCDYLAFTEHAHYTEYLEAQPEFMEKAYSAHPNMILVNGVEWSTPAGNDTRAEQAGLLMSGGANGMPLLRQFLNRKRAIYYWILIFIVVVINCSDQGLQPLAGVPHEQRIWIDDLRTYTCEQDVE